MFFCNYFSHRNRSSKKATRCLLYLYYRLSFTNTGLDIWHYMLTSFKWETISLKGMLTKLLLWGTDISVYKIFDVFWDNEKDSGEYRWKRDLAISQCHIDQKIKSSPSHLVILKDTASQCPVIRFCIPVLIGRQLGTLQRKSHLCIPFLRIAWPQCQFPY